jgi:hypothetical protein
MAAKDLIDQIKAAFCDPHAVKPPSWRDSSDWEYNDLRALMEGERWEGVEDEVFLAGYPGPCFMDDRVLAYYLPAFMIATVRHDDPSCGSLLLDNLPGDRGTRGELREIVRGWVPAKRTAIARFLEYFVTSDQSNFSDRQRQRAQRLINDLDAIDAEGVQ